MWLFLLMVSVNRDGTNWENGGSCEFMRPDEPQTFLSLTNWFRYMSLGIFLSSFLLGTAPQSQQNGRSPFLEDLTSLLSAGGGSLRQAEWKGEGILLKPFKANIPFKWLLQVATWNWSTSVVPACKSHLKGRFGSRGGGKGSSGLHLFQLNSWQAQQSCC